MHDESWKEVWERKGASASAKGNLELADLFAANGYDGAMAKIDLAGRAHLAETIQRRLALEPGHQLLEVGCGAGAILLLLRELGVKLCGVDYSAPHVAIARRTVPSAEFHEAEAAALPFADSSFDRVLAHGVFLYFESLEYAERVLAEMIRVGRPAAKLLIMDVPNAARRGETETARRAAGASLIPAHLYYPKDFFQAFAEKNHRRATIFDQEVPGYGNAAFRFNVLLESGAA